VDEVGIARYQDICANVGIRVGALDAISGHFYVYAVLDPSSSVRLGRSATLGQSGGYVDRFNTCGIEGGGIVNELTGPF
jgi:hypothetical protein